LVAAQVLTFGPTQATTTDNTDFAAETSIVVSVDDSVPGSISECFESNGESGSSFPWTEESLDEGLDYFVALDVAAAETSQRRVVGKQCVGEFSRNGRRRRMGMERGRLRVDGAGKRELLSLPNGAGIGEGDLQELFEGEELRIMLFNYREMGIIPKVEPM
jgi:hypothetical protein